MDWLQAFMLALVQGFTEFLPVSSSAHLILPSRLFGWQDQGLAFDVAVHLGTLLAVMTYYRADLRAMVTGTVSGLHQRKMNPDLKLALQVVWATLPAVMAGLLFKDFIESSLRSVDVIATTTIVFAGLLWYADRNDERLFRQLTTLGWGAALLIGLAQAMALVPGTSRSGITITVALLLGLQRTEAARFSFLLSMPVILGAALLKSNDLVQASQPIHWDMLAVGLVVSAVVAWTTIAAFVKLLDRVGMMPFVYYRLFLGAVLFVFFA